MEGVKASRRRSDVADVIKFAAEEKPPWRKGSIEYPDSVETMIKEIVQYRKEFDALNYDETSLKPIRDRFLYKYMFWLKGLETEGDTEECIKSVQSNVEPEKKYTTQEQETVNTFKAYLWLEKKVEEDCKDARDYGLIESSIAKTAHKKIMEGLPLTEGNTKPGVCSEKRRFATYKGDTHWYPLHEDPGEMEKLMDNLLDRYNSLVDAIKTEKDDVRKTSDFFKASSWLLFNLLDLHPFSNGNGRLCRLLCNYALSVFTPFPTPIYNMWSESGKDDYVQALVDARKDGDRKHPKALTTMLIECNWFAWKEFFKELGKIRFPQVE